MGEPGFGDELRSLREQHGLSLKKFAKLVHYDSGYALVSPRTASTSSRRTHDGVCLAGNGSSPQIADRMLGVLSGLGLGQVVNRETLAGMLERIVGAEVGPGVVDEWHETAWEYGYRYLADPREVLVADLTMDLARLELLLAHQSDSTARRWLNDVGARLAALLAMASVDMGYVAEARRAWQLARRRSDAGAQPETQVWVRGQEAIIGLYMARPLSVALALAERGLAIPTASPAAGTAVLLAAKAQILSRQGRGKEALDTLDTLRSAFERLPDTVTGCSDSIYGWPERRLYHSGSFVHALTGSAPQADRVHDNALSLAGEAATDRRCQIEMHRATRLVRDGHITEGVTHAATSLQSVPPQRQGTFVLVLAAGVLDLVPTTATSHAAVLGYRDQLATARHRRSAGATGA